MWGVVKLVFSFDAAFFFARCGGFDVSTFLVQVEGGILSSSLLATLVAEHGFPVKADFVISADHILRAAPTPGAIPFPFLPAYYRYQTECLMRRVGRTKARYL